MGPVAAQIWQALGAQVPGLGQALILSIPNYLCAAVAGVIAHIIHRLGGEVRKAREMGSYVLGDLIGGGGMGEVWQATHRFLARPAAIKLIKPEVLGQVTQVQAQLLVQRFRREAHAAAMLRSPHTIQLYDFGVASDGTFYYVMELLNGMDLQTRVSEHGPVPPARAIHILTQVCESLAEAHERGLVHRDIKPANIQICRMGQSRGTSARPRCRRPGTPRSISLRPWTSWCSAASGKSPASGPGVPAICVTASAAAMWRQPGPGRMRSFGGRPGWSRRLQ
jgi:serine/threonine protein kinase